MAENDDVENIPESSGIVVHNDDDEEVVGETSELINNQGTVNEWGWRKQKELINREQEGYLDEGFLSEVNAQLRQAKEDADKPGLVAMLQKVLQFYASRVLSKRSYAKKVITPCSSRTYSSHSLLHDKSALKQTCKIGPFNLNNLKQCPLLLKPRSTQVLCAVGNGEDAVGMTGFWDSRGFRAGTLLLVLCTRVASDATGFL